MKPPREFGRGSLRGTASRARVILRNVTPDLSNVLRRKWMKRKLAPSRHACERP